MLNWSFQTVLVGLCLGSLTSITYGVDPGSQPSVINELSQKVDRTMKELEDTKFELDRLRSAFGKLIKAVTMGSTSAGDFISRQAREGVQEIPDGDDVANTLHNTPLQGSDTPENAGSGTIEGAIHNIPLQDLIALLRGIAGLPGPQGAQGPQGLPGAKGESGANATDGIPGMPGTRGPQGAVGPRGAEGPQGTEGPQGVDGPQGADGPRGPPGTKGSPGLQTSPGNIGGSVYTRWGRKECGSNSTQLYEGFAGGGLVHDNTGGGGGTNYQCLPLNPQHDQYSNPNSMHSRINGAEYVTEGSSSTMPSSTNRQNVPCSRCYAHRSAVMIIPARRECPSGWTLEYHGYLMSNHHGFTLQTTFECVDGNPEFLTGQQGHADGSPFYFVRPDCSGRGNTGHCPPYSASKSVLCAVCTK